MALFKRDKVETQPGQSAADLLAQCAADYGTPEEREDRATEARIQSGLTKARAADTAKARWGK
ncbi:hypothetical protein HUT18_11820 [Streptomyces sp. NA04227]|uniref:hypothetical protein n=1 Tax=Streptomyces sp. NA04227 TaxID=2742136 RepID=UPI00159143DB|nr:hypothetical protein [Streptomyces sp. NA04227]QKW06986.1 hypothetical protein HUT18_11820 [Streptomyces sp. NA04227]